MCFTMVELLFERVTSSVGAQESTAKTVEREATDASYRSIPVEAGFFTSCYRVDEEASVEHNRCARIAG